MNRKMKSKKKSGFQRDDVDPIPLRKRRKPTKEKYKHRNVWLEEEEEEIKGLWISHRAEEEDDHLD